MPIPNGPVNLEKAKSVPNAVNAYREHPINAGGNTVSESDVKPQVVSEGDVKMVGPGHDEDHYISVPIKPLFEVKNVGDIGVCYMEPGDETCVFAIEEEDDGTAPQSIGKSGCVLARVRVWWLW